MESHDRFETIVAFSFRVYVTCLAASSNCYIDHPTCSSLLCSLVVTMSYLCCHHFVVLICFHFLHWFTLFIPVRPIIRSHFYVHIFYFLLSDNFHLIHFDYEESVIRAWWKSQLLSFSNSN